MTEKLIPASKLKALQRYSDTGDYGVIEDNDGEFIRLTDLCALIEAAPEVSSEPVFAEYYDEESGDWEKIAIKDVRAYNHAMYKTRLLYTIPQDQTALIRELVEALENANEALDPFDHKVQIAKVQAALTRAKEAIK